MSRLIDAFREQLSYMLSLPERTIRSLAALAGGTTSLLSETLFPEALRGTTLYKVFIGDAQRFMVDKVAQVQREAGADPGEAQPPDYVQRKMVGSALETAGLFAMHLSPLWVLALAGDAAAGSGVFLNRLVEQLKRNGVVPEDTQVNGLTDLLAAMQETTRKSASAIDTPPLSADELSKLATDMTSSYRQMFSKATNLVPRLDDLWVRMENVANKEHISLERLGGILSVDLAGIGRKGFGAFMAVGQTGADLFGENILENYARTLDTINAEGVSSFLGTRLKPFLQAAADAFDPNRKSWTESLLASEKKDEPTVIAPGGECASPPAAEPSAAAEPAPPRTIPVVAQPPPSPPPHPPAAP